MNVLHSSSNHRFYKSVSVNDLLLLAIFAWFTPASVRGFTAFTSDHSLFFFIHGCKPSPAGSFGGFCRFMRCFVAVGHFAFATFTPVIRIIFIFIIAFQALILVVIVLVLLIIYIIQIIFLHMSRTGTAAWMKVGVALRRFPVSVSFSSCDHNFKDF